MLHRRFLHAAPLVVLLGWVEGSAAQAGTPAEGLEGLEELRVAVEAEVHDPAVLRKRSFIIRYNGRLDEGEKFVLRLDPRAAFTLKRKSDRAYVVRITAPEVLLQDDFVSEITVHAARESSHSLASPGQGRCALAVRLETDLGRPVTLSKYRRVDVLWTPEAAANLIGRGKSHILFRRNQGYERTAVQVYAILTLSDGSERETKPTGLGYCASESGSRAGLLLGGGGRFGSGFRGFGEIAIPFELRFDRAHVRLGPALLIREDGVGFLGQAFVGHRFGQGLGLRVGGEAGATTGEEGGFRAAGILEGTWSLDQDAIWEIGLRGRVGSEASETFGEIMLTLSVLPFSL